jgi:pimeloyl-ACP methyl ester carboxylesterase
MSRAPLSPSPRPRLARRAALAVAVPLALAVPAALTATPAVAGDRVLSVASPGPGPVASDRVRVLQQGPSTAKHVLVLMPGTSAGAASFRPVAKALLARLPGWQVWSVDRRENTLKDESVLRQAQLGKVTGQQLFDYYLGWIANPDAPATHFAPVSDAAASYARDWGMRVTVEDLHRVVRLARRGGRKVVLGGHSLGGTITTAYATWDFAGRAGAKDLAGLVYIDGGSGGGRAAVTPAAARKELAAIGAGSPFLDLTGLGLPWSAGVFNAVGSTLALREPDAPSLLQAWRFLPATLKPPVTASNAAAYGYAVDTQTGPKSLALVQSHLGQLAASGDPRGFVDGGLAPVSRAATVFAGAPGMDGSSWYHPRRLSLDGGAVNDGLPTPAQKLLGLRTTRGRDVHVPIYAFSTSLGADRVLNAARTLGRQSHVPARDTTLVDRAATYAHIDPISASPAKNDFVKTVVRFLRRIG